MRFKEVRQLVKDMEYISNYINGHQAIKNDDSSRTKFLTNTMNRELKRIQETVDTFERRVREKNNLGSYSETVTWDSFGGIEMHGLMSHAHLSKYA